MVYPAEMLLIAVSKSIGAFCVPAAVDFPDGDTYKSPFVCSGSDGVVGVSGSDGVVGYSGCVGSVGVTGVVGVSDCCETDI